MHGSHKSTTNTLEDGADLRPVSQNTRKKFRSSALPSHRRRDKIPNRFHLSLSQLRALNGQLLWLGKPCLSQSLAPLSLLMGQHRKPQWTRSMRCTSWPGRRLRGPECHSKSMLTILRLWLRTQMLGWTTRPDGNSQGKQLVFIANSELLQGKESNMSLISRHSSRLTREARSSSAADTEAAADGDDEAVYIRLCLKEVLFGQLDLQNWQSEARPILAALVVHCRGVYDALGRSSSSCRGLKDKKSGLEALALKTESR